MTKDNTLTQRRRDNLRRWMRVSNTSSSELADKLQVGRAYASLLFNPERSFGERAARSIERKLGMTEGFLDSQGDGPLAVGSWERASDIQPGMYGLVPQNRLSVSLERGCVEVYHTDLPPLALRGERLVAAGVTERARLVFGEQRGDSMSPYIEDGDLFLVDAGQVEVEDGMVYAILYGEDVRLRRLSRRFDGGVLLRPDNARYPEEVLTRDEAEQVTVIGRVIWRAG